MESQHCGCGAGLRRNNRHGLCAACYYKSPQRLEAMRPVNRRWLQAVLANPSRKADFNAKKRDYYHRRNSTPQGKVRWLIYCARSRARRLGMPVDIEVADLLPLPTICPVLGITLDYTCSKRPRNQSASLDRIVPSEGYVRGNVRIISWRANVVRKDGTAEELMAVALDAARIAKPRLTIV